VTVVFGPRNVARRFQQRALGELRLRGEQRAHRQLRIGVEARAPAAAVRRVDGVRLAGVLEDRARTEVDVVGERPHVERRVEKELDDRCAGARCAQQRRVEHERAHDGSLASAA
jgi:hypothetical protein